MSSTDETSVFKSIVHEEDQQQFVMTFKDSHLSGIIQYQVDPKMNTLDIYHTEVPIEHRGQGLGQILVQKVKDYADSKKMNLIASCHYAHKVLSKR